jgi:hypothetical protein
LFPRGVRGGIDTSVAAVTGLGKTAWVDSIMTQVWPALVQRVPREMLPRQIESKRASARIKVEEYGCGHYGCVMPTGKPGIVCKLTSDPTEVAFVEYAAAIADDDGWPEGIVKYVEMFKIAGSSGRRGRDVALLWREEAFEVGYLMRGLPAGTDGYMYREATRFTQLLGRYKDHASVVRKILTRSANPQKLLDEAKRYEDWAWRRLNDPAVARAGQQFKGGQAVAAELAICANFATSMLNNEVGNHVGEALEFYQERGLLLADVHANNIGKVARDPVDPDDRLTVITDPGHAVVLKPDLPIREFETLALVA